MKTRFVPPLHSVKEYYTEKALASVAISRGADLNSLEAQQLRFEQLLKVVDARRRFSINDCGCGYGHLYGYMKDRGYDFDYFGFDLSEARIKEAVRIHGKFPNCSFRVASSTNTPADYTVASAVFNVKFTYSDSEWLKYILATITNMDRISRKGFAFNCLTMYSDKVYMRDDFYYADPLYLFDYCKRHFSKNVALLHDYGLYDFTIIVRK